MISGSATTVSFLLAAALATAGCGPGAGHVAAITDTIIVGPEYTARGIRVPDDTRRSLGLKVVEIGEGKVTTSVELTFRVYENTGAKVRASAFLAGGESALLTPGLALEVVMPDGRRAAATITAIHDGLEDITGQVEVIAGIFTNAEIPVGSFVSARAMVEGTEVVSSVPRSAVIEGVDGSFVYTTSGDRFVRTPVVVGALMDDIAEIKEGLYSGDEVVAEPAMALWLTELAAIKGGHACCAVPAKGK